VKVDATGSILLSMTVLNDIHIDFGGRDANYGQGYDKYA
jgi:hypothetical protein